MSISKEQIAGIGAVAALAVLVVIGMWQTRGERHTASYMALSTEPEGIMGTSCMLSAIALPDSEDRSRQALLDAEQTLRGLEMLMSSWLEGSEISRFNSAGAGLEFRLSAESLHVLEMAHAAFTTTGGAFDITVGPLIKLWRRASETGVMPYEEELMAARATSNWDLIELVPEGAVKRGAGAEVDLGGIAKGYAIDRAVEAMRRTGANGGLVDVGGDLRVFGIPPEGGLWVVDVRNPFGAGRLARIGITSGAVCTSGNYSRFFEIEGARFSHIIDPRSGRPATSTTSVTVVAETAVEGDIWATALSVLGPQGMEQLPVGIEAILVVGEEEDFRLYTTPGFRDLYQEEP